MRIILASRTYAPTRAASFRSIRGAAPRDHDTVLRRDTFFAAFFPVLFAGVSVFAQALAAMQSPTASANDITVRPPLRTLATREVVHVTEKTLEAGVVGAITASADGRVVVADVSNMWLIVLSPDGRRERTIGRRGSGPGEFASISSLAWIGDTLVVLDRSARRATFVIPSQGRILGTRSLAGSDRPINLLTAGPSAILVSGRSQRASAPAGGGRSSWPTSVPTFARITLAGSQPIGVSPLSSEGSPPSRGSLDCEDRAGVVHILDPLMPARGELLGVTSAGNMVQARRDAYRITVHSLAGGQQLRNISGSFDAVTITDRLWDSLSTPVTRATNVYGALRCNPPITRPRSLPAIDALAIDPASDNFWIEVPEETGASIHVLGPNGAALGRFSLPARDVRISWFPRGNKLYYVTLEPSGLQEVRVLSVEGL